MAPIDYSQGLLHPVVCVPARNEEQRLPALLSALNDQTWCDRTRRQLAVVVVLNNCIDGTTEAVLDALPGLPRLAVECIEIDFPPADAHVGSARRLAMERAAALCPAEGGVILTTDADAVPDRDWIEANLRALAGGADIVGGKLIGNREEEARLGPGFAARAEAVLRYGELCDRLAWLIDPLEHDPWPRHCDHTGASLAIRADLYEAVGGLPPLPRREDLALVSRARAAGGRLVHPLDVRVEVSARLVGRASGGMADCLKDWLRAEAEGRPLLVEDPLCVEARLRRRRSIRDLATEPGAVRELAGIESGIDIAATKADSRPPTPAGMVERYAPDDPDASGTVVVSLATARLEEMIILIEGDTRAA